MEDILSVSILVLMPIFAASSDGFDWQTVGFTLLKAAAFIALMFFIGVRLFPWVIEKIAHTRSRELFLLAALAITLGSAIGASQLFGVSMALGAFIAGAIISQSRLSHQVGADLFAFREAFSVLFFVSVGMLVNPLFLWENLGHVAALSLLVVVGKTVIVILMGLVMPRPARTFLVVAIGLGQIGEFSFILGQSAVYLKMLSEDQYSLILAAALISIAVNPFMYKLLPVLETTLQWIPWFWKRLEVHIPVPEFQEDQFVDHVVIIGFGRIGKHMVSVLESLSIPLLVIEADAERMAILNQRHIPTLYGDAGNSDVIVHAHLERARALVTTVPDESTAMMIVTAARDLNPNLQIIARAATEDGVHHLIELGADHVVHPELEGGLELMHHTLLSLGFPLSEVHHFAETVRRDRYDFDITTDEEHRSLHDLLLSMKGIEIVWMSIDAAGSLVGKSLAEVNLRAHTGASVVALVRNGQLTANPKSMTVFEPGDRIGVIGEKEQIEVVQGLLKMA
jgi:CPA2 family monovalent cation:H+ antiporter-2